MSELEQATPEENQKEQEKIDGTPSLIMDNEGYILLKFQCGPIAEVGVNGIQIDRILDILIKRLEGFQKGPFSCRENALAITKLQEALHWLEHRTKDRIARKVEGMNKI